MYSQSSGFCHLLSCIWHLVCIFRAFQLSILSGHVCSIFFSFLSFWKKKALHKGHIVYDCYILYDKSAYAIPIYFTAGIKWKKVHVIILTVLASTGVIFGDFYLKIMLKLYPSYVVSAGVYAKANPVTV